MKHKRWKFWVGCFFLVSAVASVLNVRRFDFGDAVVLALFVPWGIYWVLKNSNVGYTLGIYAKTEREQEDDGKHELK